MVEVVAAGALLEEGRILLCHRSPDRRWYPNVWDLPGGHVEPGEDCRQALKRELLEELGIETGPLAAKPLDQISTPDFEMSIWLVVNWEGLPENRAKEEHDTIGWFTASELRALNLAHPAYLSLLSRALARR